jgi:hypothetical protein
MLIKPIIDTWSPQYEFLTGFLRDFEDLAVKVGPIVEAIDEIERQLDPSTVWHDTPMVGRVGEQT